MAAVLAWNLMWGIRALGKSENGKFKITNQRRWNPSYSEIAEGMRALFKSEKDRNTDHCCRNPSYIVIAEDCKV